MERMMDYTWEKMTDVEKAEYIQKKLAGINKVNDALGHYHVTMDDVFVDTWCDQDGGIHVIFLNHEAMTKDEKKAIRSYYNGFYTTGTQCFKLSNIFRKVGDVYGLTVSEIVGYVICTSHSVHANYQPAGVLALLAAEVK